MNRQFENVNYFLNSDTEIYNALLDAKKSGHHMLKHFKILYPNKIPQDPVNAVYVGRLDTIQKEDENSFDHYQWEVTTDVFITTKKYDKIDRYRMLKSATFAVIEVLLKSKVGAFIKIKNQSFVYDTNNLIQVSRLTVETKENSYTDKAEHEVKRICGILSQIDVEGTMKERKMKCDKNDKGV